MLTAKEYIVSLLTIISCCIIFGGCGTEKFEIIENKCGKCHGAFLVYEKKRSLDEWERLVFRMKVLGLKISAVEEKELMSVLNNSLSQE